MTDSYIPILLMLIAAGAMGAVMLGLSWMLGRHQRNRHSLPTRRRASLDETRKRMNVRFYQIAMLFILFDIEAAFLYPWAVIYRDATALRAHWRGSCSGNAAVHPSSGRRLRRLEEGPDWVIPGRKWPTSI
jgi:NADH:ubiquinone oxidoreductase subunit 3 (subunit A)